MYIVPTTDLDDTYFITKLPVGVQIMCGFIKIRFLWEKAINCFCMISMEKIWIPIASLKHFNLKKSPEWQ